MSDKFKESDYLVDKSNGYLNNPNLPKENTKIKWTAELLAEYKKCFEDPVYFAEKYCHIITIDDGIIPIKLFDFQKDIVQAYPTNLKLLLNQSRQSGKCVFKDTKYEVRNKKTGEILHVTAEEFHEIANKRKFELQHE